MNSAIAPATKEKSVRAWAAGRKSHSPEKPNMRTKGT
jgi:hypothetical protein